MTATELEEMQFEILPTADAESGLVFGIGADVSVNEDGFIPGATDWSIQDGENPTRGTTAFGRDRLLGSTWAWMLHVDKHSVKTAVAALSTFSAAWRAREIRETPGAVLAIRYQLAGRTRRIYGRPRKLDAPPTNLILNGFIPISVDFKAVDGQTYEDVSDSITLSLETGGSEGGFVFPVVFPVASMPVGGRSVQAVVGGDAPTYPVIRFEGPVSSPELVHKDWEIRLAMEIPAGQYVEVDTRPWALTVLQNGVTSVAGKLAPRQWLSDVKLKPGRHDLTYRGYADTGGSTVTVTWASAYESY